MNRPSKLRRKEKRANERREAEEALRRIEGEQAPARIQAEEEQTRDLQESPSSTGTSETKALLEAEDTRARAEITNLLEDIVEKIVKKSQAQLEAEAGEASIRKQIADLLAGIVDTIIQVEQQWGTEIFSLRIRTNARKRRAIVHDSVARKDRMTPDVYSHPVMASGVDIALRPYPGLGAEYTEERPAQAPQPGHGVEAAVGHWRVP